MRGAILKELKKYLAIVLVSCLASESGITRLISKPPFTLISSLQQRLYESEALAPPLDWTLSSLDAEAHKTIEAAVVIGRFDEGTYKEDFSHFLDEGQTRKELTPKLAAYADGLATIYSDDKILVRIQNKLKEKLGAPASVEIVNMASLIPKKNSGASGLLYLKGGTLHYKIQNGLIHALNNEPAFIDPLVAFVCHYFENVRKGMPDEEAYTSALQVDPALEDFLNRTLVELWKIRPDSRFVLDDYVPGRPLPEDLSYLNYGMLGNGHYDFMMRKGAGWILQSDPWLESEAGAMYRIGGAREKYEQTLIRDIFQNEAFRKTLTAEQVYGEVVKIRNREFPAIRHRIDLLLHGNYFAYETKRVAEILQRYTLKKADFGQAVRAALLTEHGNNIYEKTLKVKGLEEDLDIWGEKNEDLEDSPITPSGKLREWLSEPQPDDDLDDFARQLSKPTTYVHAVGGVDSLAGDLMVFGQMLLEKWNGKGEVVFLVKKERIGSDAAESDIQLLLGEPQFQSLVNNPRFKVVPISEETPGLDFRNIRGEAASWLEKVQKHKAILGLRGENNFFTANGILLDHYRLTLARTVETQRAIGFNWDAHSRRSPPAIVVRVPSGIPPYGKDETVPLFIKTRRLLEKSASGRSLQDLYDSIRRRMYKNNLTFVEAAAPEQLWGSLPWPVEAIKEQYARLPKEDLLLYPTIGDFVFSKRNEWLTSIAKLRAGSDHYIGTTYTLMGSNTEPEPAGMIENVLPTKLLRRTYVNGVVASSKSMSLRFVKSPEVKLPGNNSSQAVISYRDVFRAFFDALFCINGIYDVTDIVFKEYNRARRRAKRYLEVLNKTVLNSYIDAVQYMDREGKRQETAPLFNKAFIGERQDGTLVFGWRRMLGGSMRILNPNISSSEDEPKDFSIRWESKDLIDNEAKLAKLEDNDPDVAVITPMASRIISSKDPSSFKRLSTYFNREVLRVGKGRINIIVIDNKIMSISDRDVLMPSFGIVISLKRSTYRKWFKDNEFLNRNNDLPSANFTYDWPKDSERPAWYAGGGALLVHNGINLVRNKAIQEENWTKEGWYHLLSNHTQGTSVHKWEIGPRSISGDAISSTGEIFTFAFTLSGRTYRYGGVNVAEAVEIVQAELAKLGLTIRNAINMDGGSSVGMSVREGNANGQIHSLTYAAEGSSNREGELRNVASYLVFEPKRTKAKAKRSKSALLQRGS